MSDPLVEEIVRRVLGELQSSGGDVRGSAMLVRSSAIPATGTQASLRDKVITAEILEATFPGESAAGLKKLHVAATAVLTPSAREWLKSKNIAWERNAGADGACQKRAAFAVVLQSNPALDQALDESSWRQERIDCPDKAVDRVVSELERGNEAIAAAFTSRPSAMACAMNRRQEARAAVAESAACIERIRQEMKANVFCVNPEGKSYFELARLLKAINDR